MGSCWSNLELRGRRTPVRNRSHSPLETRWRCRPRAGVPACIHFRTIGNAEPRRKVIAVRSKVAGHASGCNLQCRRAENALGDTGNLVAQANVHGQVGAKLAFRARAFFKNEEALGYLVIGWIGQFLGHRKKLYKKLFSRNRIPLPDGLGQCR